VYCKCGAQAGEADDEERAIALWNTRTPVESQETPVESLLCPFCGGQEKEDYQQGMYFWVWCKCGAQGSHAANKQEAIALWNSRKAQSNTREKLMKKIIASALLLPVLTFAPPGLTQVVIDFQSQPTIEQLIQVVESATRDKNYPTALRVANNAVG
jgi:Lar family restriction alleviation protein